VSSPTGDCGQKFWMRLEMQAISPPVPLPGAEDYKPFGNLRVE
jgi:hypothetical protein